MDLVDNLSIGFATALSLQNLFFALSGCLLGTLIGVLPGIGPLAAISMLLPFTYGLDPTGALIMLAGIYYGGAYGGSATAILVNLPGETSSIVTMIDGHRMAKQGRAGVAISAAALGSFFAGCVGTLILAAFAGTLTSVALRFGGAEYFSLMVVGLLGAVSLTAGSTLKAIGMVLIGILLGLVGTDIQTGELRFTFGQPNLWEGIDIVVIAIGIFAFGETVATLEANEGSDTACAPITTLLPTATDLRRMAPSVLRGTTVGSLLGILPGAGQTVASFISYAVEKRVSRNRAEIGSGAIEGVAAPESANNAAAQTAFIPTLTLGIPGSATMALMLGAMMMHNIQPGPRIMSTNPELFWGLVVSMLIGNLILLILNLPLVGLWVQLLRIPYKLLFFAIVMFSCFGVYSAHFSSFDLYLAAGFGLAGYLMRRLRCDPAPLLLGFVLGPMLEDNFRRAMVLARGDLSVFLTQPISAAFLFVAVVFVALTLLPGFRRKRDEIAIEDL